MKTAITVTFEGGGKTTTTSQGHADGVSALLAVDALLVLVEDRYGIPREVAFNILRVKQEGDLR